MQKGDALCQINCPNISTKNSAQSQVAWAHLIHLTLVPVLSSIACMPASCQNGQWTQPNELSAPNCGYQSNVMQMQIDQMQQQQLAAAAALLNCISNRTSI